jgi:hypothetical protein
MIDLCDAALSSARVREQRPLFSQRVHVGHLRYRNSCGPHGALTEERECDELEGSGCDPLSHDWCNNLDHPPQHEAQWLETLGVSDA